jgi:hypothetical protein
MVGQELTKHLQHIEEQLAKLIISYQDYQFRNKQKEQQNIPLSRHILYAIAIIIIIITATYAIASIILDARVNILYIAAVQTILSISLYMYFAKKMTKDTMTEQKTQIKINSNMSIYELDKLRFEILQELATSPIPQNYMTPTAIKKMHQFVKSGICFTIEECVALFEKEAKKQKHKDELELIQHLQTISFH